MNEQKTFEQELQSLINRHSVENQSDTPDFILASYLTGCLQMYNNAVMKRDKWFSVDMWAKDKIAKVEKPKEERNFTHGRGPLNDYDT